MGSEESQQGRRAVLRTHEGEDGTGSLHVSSDLNTCAVIINTCKKKN